MRGVPSEEQWRIARNETTFRSINEDIERGRDAEDDQTQVGFICECGAEDCSRLIELTPAEYEHVRDDPCTFAIVDGHEIPEVEAVVERHPNYIVVRQLEPTGTVAKETDPRA